MGVSDIAYELKLLFSNGFAALTPALSLLLRKQCLLLREPSQSHRDKHCLRSERGGILAVFPVFISLHKHTEKCDSPKI